MPKVYNTSWLRESQVLKWRLSAYNFSFSVSFEKLFLKSFMSAKKFNPHSRLEINMANVKLKQIRKSYWKISSETIDKKIRRATNVVPPLFLNKWCSPANSSLTSHNIQQTWKAVFGNCSLWLRVKRQAYDLLINGVQKPVSRY